MFFLEKTFMFYLSKSFVSAILFWSPILVEKGPPGPGSAEVSSFAQKSCRAALGDGTVPGFARLLATTRGDRSLEHGGVTEWV